LKFRFEAQRSLTKVERKLQVARFACAHVAGNLGLQPLQRERSDLCNGSAATRRARLPKVQVLTTKHIREDIPETEAVLHRFFVQHIGLR
jgi:hypothetical protein